ncbi:hypothetical protein C7A07_21885 [Pseudomonas fragi]|nr:hypothetical protein C7A07_21885 [Pseudomonas fragi]
MITIKFLAETGILAILLTLAGWGFVFKNSRSLALQSEINTIAAAMEKLLQEIADENYKFWKDVKDDDMDHLTKSKLFSSYIEHRCNIIERKIDIIYGKCCKTINPEVEKLGFNSKCIDLIAKIRDRSTINSEQPKQVKEKYGRINAINSYTLKLSNEISRLVTTRSKPMSEWEWPHNY